MIIKFNCKTCGKVTEVISTEDTSNGKYTREMLKCGHVRVVKKLEVKALDITVDTSKPLLTSLEGFKTFKYQDEGIVFAERANLRVLIADEMGLGKTVQSIGALMRQRDAALPVIIVCKTIAKYNWYKEVLKWSCASLIPQEINTGKDTWFDMFQVHICSFDMIRSFLCKSKSNREVEDYFTSEDDLVNEKKYKKEPIVRPDVKKIVERAKTIIIDECHYIKNDISQRTVAIKTLCKGKKHVIALSGTPIKNNAAEYFPILNILHPEIFSNRASFISTYCANEWTGYAYKIGGLKDPEYFKERTQNFVIRREMKDVLPDLPEVRRNNSFVELEGDVLDIYNAAWKDFVKAYDDMGEKKTFDDYNEILAKLAILRHCTGLAKIDAAVEFTEDFLTSTTRKITLFVHHKHVANQLQIKINDRITLLNKELGTKIGPVVTLLAEDVSRASEKVEEFKKDESRVLIASTLAAGESINLQFCSDCLLVERQWNPANEEQAAVGRFKRIGQKNSIQLNYLLAVATIDDYFTEIVEKKRQIFEEVMAGKKSETNWDESSILLELAEVLAVKGRQKFKI